MITEFLYSGLVTPHLEYYVLLRAAQYKTGGDIGESSFKDWLQSWSISSCEEGLL